MRVGSKHAVATINWRTTHAGVVGQFAVAAFYEGRNSLRIEDRRS